MTDIEEMRDLMIELIESVDSTGDLTFPVRAVEIIREIAEFAKQTKLYMENKDKAESFWNDEDATPKRVWAFMLERVVSSPTTFHRDASVILHMPQLDAALDKTQI